MPGCRRWRWDWTPICSPSVHRQLAVGADVPGDVQIVPAGETPLEPAPLADTSRAEDPDFAALADAVDLHGLPGVQSKASASMLTTPLALAARRYLLKLDPPLHRHLVANEAAHLTGATALKIPVAAHSVVRDRLGLPGLLVERFDRIHNGVGGGDVVRRVPLEDAARVMNLPPASKYAVSQRMSSPWLGCARRGRWPCGTSTCSSCSHGVPATVTCT